jgi:hypothetical protein
MAVAVECKRNVRKKAEKNKDVYIKDDEEREREKERERKRE